MTTEEQPSIAVGSVVLGQGGRRVGTVDAVFVDYLLVRTKGILPVDLYIPRTHVSVGDGSVRVECTAREAYDRWHRPLKRAPHADG